MLEEKRNIVLGAGRLYFDPFDDAGEKTGEIYLGETPGFGLSVAVEKTDVYSSDTPTAEKISSVVRSITRTANITCEHISAENLAMFVGGRSKEVAQPSQAVAHEERKVKKGRWYQVGKNLKEVKGVSVEKKVGLADEEVVYAVDDDYILDADMGRIYIKPDGSIADDAIVEFSYMTLAPHLKYDQVETTANASLTGALRWIADNAEGANKDLYAPYAELAPSGESALQSRETPMQISFSAEFLARGGQPALYINGRPD